MPKLDDSDSLIANNPQVLLISGGTGFFWKGSSAVLAVAEGESAQAIVSNYPEPFARSLLGNVPRVPRSELDYLGHRRLNQTGIYVGSRGSGGLSRTSCRN